MEGLDTGDSMSAAGPITDIRWDLGAATRDRALISGKLAPPGGLADISAAGALISGFWRLGR
jgi:hypothetical protein